MGEDGAWLERDRECACVCVCDRERDLVVGEDGAAGLEQVAVDERHDVHVVLRAHRRRHDRCAQEEGRYQAT